MGRIDSLAQAKMARQHSESFPGLASPRQSAQKPVAEPLGTADADTASLRGPRRMNRGVIRRRVPKFRALANRHRVMRPGGHWEQRWGEQGSSCRSSLDGYTSRFGAGAPALWLQFVVHLAATVAAVAS
jgi:hypothetical protein